MRGVWGSLGWKMRKQRQWKERKKGAGKRAQGQSQRSSRVERVKCWRQLFPSTFFETKVLYLTLLQAEGRDRLGIGGGTGVGVLRIEGVANRNRTGKNTSFSPQQFDCFSLGCLVWFSYIFIFVLFAYGEVCNKRGKTLYKSVASQFFSRKGLKVTIFLEYACI